jgi:hypothetical protein
MASSWQRGGRHVRGGRAAVRRVLDLAALSAGRHLTAVSRKLPVIANAVLRIGRPWDQEFAMAC